MNVLAYGGTRFEERQRIGEWQSDLDHVLRDQYGLSGESLSFGVGRRDGRLCVIIRQRQNVWNRGGYPYTLLLDPGDQIWTAFEWNGARLLGALFLGTDPPGDPLLKEPERLGQKSIEEILRKLQKPPIQTVDSPAAEKVRQLFVGGVALADPMAVSLPDLGMPGRPTLEWMAGVIAGLPVCFRCSAGWLVGSGASHGRVLGAHVVIDDQVEEGALQNLTPASQEYWKDWQIIAKTPEFRGALTEWSKQPAWEWSDSPESVLSRVRTLARYVTSNMVPDEDYESLLASQESQGPLANEIHKIVTRICTAGEEPFTAASTRYLLARSLDNNLNLSESIAARMDCVSVENDLQARGIDPWKTPAQFQMPKPFLIEVLGVALGRVEIDSLTKLFGRILDSCRHLGTQGLCQLAEVTVSRLPETTGNLMDWLRLKHDQQVGAVFDGRLESVARERTLGKRGGYATGYIFFGNDPGGVKLPPDADGNAFYEALKQLLSGGASPIAPGVPQKWFTALATSPFRRRLTPEWKRELAGMPDVRQAWAPLLRMMELFEGKRVEGGSRSVSDVERRHLSDEFERLATKHQSFSTAPFLDEILDMVDPPGPAIVELIEKFKTTTTDVEAFKSWVKGLARIKAKNLIPEQLRLPQNASSPSQPDGKSPAQEDETLPSNFEDIVAFILFDRHGKSSADDAAAANTETLSPEPDAPPAAGRIRFSTLKIFGGGNSETAKRNDETPEAAVISEPPDKKVEQELLERLKDLVGKFGGQPSVREAIRRVIDANIETNGSFFAKRISKDEDAVEAILEALPDANRQKVAACLADYDDEFAKAITGSLLEIRDKLEDGRKRHIPIRIGALSKCLTNKKYRQMAMSIQKNLGMTPAGFRKFLEQIQSEFKLTAAEDKNRAKTAGEPS